MAKRLYVGNLVFSVTSTDLRDLFAEHGAVQSAQVQVVRETGRSRGFGFVEMDNDGEAEAAVAQIDGSEFRGRRLNVNEAQPKIPAGPGRDHRGPGPGPGRSGPRGGFGPGGRS